MDKKKNLYYETIFIIITIGIVGIINLIAISNENQKSINIITNEIKKNQPHKVKYDYEIDLQPKFIIVYSKHGNVDTIPYGILENFFEMDNL